MTGEHEPRRVDLSDYNVRARALELANYGCPTAYTEVARKHLTKGDLPFTYTLFGSFVSRMRGLHEGVVRELTNDNPHAVLPLNRAWVEVLTIGLYTLRNPQYVDLLMNGPAPSRPARKSFTAMFHAVREDAGQLDLVYRDLSDYSHFGVLGVWNAHAQDGEDGASFTWTDAPRWRNERSFQQACAQANELAHAGLDTLDRLGSLLVSDTR